MAPAQHPDLGLMNADEGTDGIVFWQRHILHVKVTAAARAKGPDPQPAAMCTVHPIAYAPLPSLPPWYGTMTDSNKR